MNSSVMRVSALGAQRKQLKRKLKKQIEIASMIHESERTEGEILKSSKNSLTLMIGRQIHHF